MVYLKALENKNNIKHDFFSVIDSEEKAYILGFFASDGHIAKRKDCNVYHLGWQLAAKDVDILHKINKIMSNDVCSIRLNEKRNHYTLLIPSKQIGLDLYKLGYDNRKTYTCNRIPDIPTNLMPHFIRGYFDGDGSITFGRKGKHNVPHRTINFACRNVSILEQISKHLPIDNFCIVKTIKYKEDPDKSFAYYLIISKKSSVQDLYKYMYENATIYLNRKKEKYEECLIFNNSISPKRGRYTEEQVREIRNKYSQGLKIKNIMQMMGLHHYWSIVDITSGRSYKWVLDKKEDEDVQ